MTIAFVVAGNPVPWERTEGNGRRRYTAPRTRAHEALIAGAAKIAGATPVDGPVRLAVKFFRDSAHRCDIDNLTKSVQDALNGIAYRDDSQIVEVVASKAIDRERPRTEVTVFPLVPLTLTVDAEAVSRERKAMLSAVSPKARAGVLAKRLVSSVRRPA